MSRILIWSPNYAPEPIGIAPLVTSAAEWLAARGHAVDVVTALPNYPERVIRPEFRGRPYRSALENGVRVHRSWLRVRPGESFLDKALYEGSFALASLPRVARRVRRADVLLCLVPSLAAAAVAVALPVRRRVLWVQDLVAAAAATLEGAPTRGLAAARGLEGVAARGADRVVVCSPGFGEHLTELGVPRERIATVYNWVDVDEIEASPPRAAGDGRRFLYAGNLGYTQSFDTMIQAARLADVELEIVGDGNAADAVRRLANGSVHLRPSVPRGDYSSLLASADAHVVVQRREAAGANLPSKIGSYLASGRPIVASIGLDTSAADLLRESGAALIVGPEEPAELAAAMIRVRDDPVLRAELGRRARAFAELRLGRDAALEALERELVG